MGPVFVGDRLQPCIRSEFGELYRITLQQNESIASQGSSVTEQLLYVHEGQGTLALNGSEIRLLSEASAFIPRGTTITIKNSGTAGKLTVLYYNLTRTASGIVDVGSIKHTITHRIHAIELAPDGSTVHVLANSTTGSGGLCIAIMPPGCTSTAVSHKTVGEIWYVLTGNGEFWNSKDSTFTTLDPGKILVIEKGNKFQFSAEHGQVPLRIAILTVGSWPGSSEAEIYPDCVALGTPSCGTTALGHGH